MIIIMIFDLVYGKDITTYKQGHPLKDGKIIRNRSAHLTQYPSKQKRGYKPFG